MCYNKNKMTQGKAQREWYERNKEAEKIRGREWYRNNKEAQKARNISRKRHNRQKAIEALGGACVDCGATEALEFDHKHPGTKTNPIPSIVGSINKLMEEIKVCELRCKACHRLRTSQQHALAYHLLRSVPESLMEQWLRTHPDPQQVQSSLSTVQ